MVEITWTNETRKLGELIPWPRNPRQIKTDQARRLVESFDQFGQVETIAIGPGNEIYNGHQRLNVLMDKYGGDYEVECRVSSRPLAEKEREKLTVYLHKGAAGEWDWDTLANEFEVDELVEWGFSEKDLQIGGFDLDEPKGDDPGAQVDKAEELRQKWDVEPGQLWQLGEHRLICGDCTDKDVVIRVMQGDKATLTVTSPPYAVGKEYEEGVTFESHLALLRGFADRAIEITVPGGFIFTNFGEIAALSHASKLTGSKRQCIYPISQDYWQIFHKERGCDLYAMRIWYKPFNRLQQPFWSYKTSIPHHQEWEHIWTWRVPGGDTDRVCDWDISVHAIWDTRNEATDDKPLTRHVAAFPVCLPERAIKAHSLKGEIVYEPFSGSGTTLIACERLGRKCRAVEISPAYCAVAIQRWVDMTGGEPELVDQGTYE